MFHRLLIGLTCVAAMAGSASAQSAKNNKLVRVTYPVADLVVPIPNYSKGDRAKEPELTKEALAEQLKEMITQSIAPRTWESAGGRGNIQYFPFGMAIVVEQRADVQEQIAKLLEDLRRLQDVQICVETRFVCCSERGAKSIWQHLDKHGQGVRVHQAESSLDKTDQARKMRSLDDKQLFAVLTEAQSDRSAHIMQAPKITMFNGQKVILASCYPTAKGEPREGFQCELLSVVDPHSKAVRLSMDMEITKRFIDKLGQNVNASATVSIPPERTLVWHLGTANDRHLFVVMTPRMVVAADEQRIFAGEKPIPSRPESARPWSRGGAEEQSIPEQKKPDARVIEYRLRQPICINFKDVPLKEAIKDLSLLTGVSIVPDIKALKEARVNLDTPISIVVDNVDFQQALKLMFNPLGLRYVIANDVLMITTPDEVTSSLIRKTYKVADLVDVPGPVTDVAKISEHLQKAVNGGWARAKPASDEKIAGAMVELIQNTVAGNSWEAMGGRGSIQYFPREKVLVINQTQEVHEEVDLLLATLRRAYDLTVGLDVRVVQMPADAAKRWRNAMTERDDPLLAAMRLLENGDRVTTITRPTLRVLNGQQGIIETGDQASGCKYDVLPVVTPDRKSVRLTMNIEYRTKDEARSVEHVMKASKRLEAPDGRTQVWDVGATAGGQHLFVLITPRVIDRSEKEERLFLGEIEPIPGR